MDKTTFINSINCEEMEIANLYEKLILCEKTGKVTFSNHFFSPKVWSALGKISKKIECNIVTDGIFNDSERRMIGFVPTFYDKEDLIIPVKLLKIENKSKFDILEHKDYLGSLMSIGIVREKFGDMIVEGNVCYVPICEDISIFISLNLESAGRVPINVSILEKDEIKLPEYKFEDMNIVLASLRADAVTASICGLSRSAASEIVESGKFMVNYESVTDKDFEVKIPSTITIRKYGKFIIKNLCGETKKGKLKVGVAKYI